MTIEREVLRSLYSPESGMIACVLLQAAYGGDRTPCHWFGPGDWETGHLDSTYGWISLTREDWRALGLMPREERVARWKAASDRDRDPEGAETPKSGSVAEGDRARAEGIAQAQSEPTNE